jgi:hypothetical protein
MRAACHACGSIKKVPLIPCKACGFIPSGSARATAWLFSLEYLSKEELAEAAGRVRAGQRAEASQALLFTAKKAMGALPFERDTDRPLTTGEQWALALTNLLLTPLAGLALWHGLRASRPQAARQSLRLTWPIALALCLMWISLF